MVRVASNTGPTVLDLSDCDLREEQFQVICRDLETNDSIRRVDLYGNALSERVIDCFIRSLEHNNILSWILVEDLIAIDPDKVKKLQKLLDRNVSRRLTLNCTYAPTDFAGAETFGFHLGPMQWTSDQRPLLAGREPVLDTAILQMRARLQQIEPLPGWNPKTLQPCLASVVPGSTEDDEISQADSSGLDRDRARTPCSLLLKIVAVTQFSRDWPHFGTAFSKREVSTGCRWFWMALRGPSRIGFMLAPRPESRAIDDEEGNGAAHASIARLSWDEIPRSGQLAVYYFDGLHGKFPGRESLAFVSHVKYALTYLHPILLMSWSKPETKLPPSAPIYTVPRFVSLNHVLVSSGLLKLAQCYL